MERNVEQRYIPIFLESVLTNTILDFDLYLYNRSANKYVLYRSRRTQFHEKNRLQLLDMKIPALFIVCDDLVRYQHYIEKNLNDVVNNRGLRSEEKANIIYQTARNLMEEIMEKPLVGESIKRSRRFVKNTVRYIIKEKDYFFNIINLTSHDYHTYTHSVDVCVYALSLAQKVGITSPYQLNIIGAGALLHDIGKSAIPQEVLLKKGPLTDEEWVLVKTHPTKGVDILNKHKMIHHDIFSIVKHHHEKLDGSGYPDGLKGDDIPYYAKITCIADIFDALNTNRPYKKAADTFHSLEIMNEEFDGKIDRELYREFILLFKL